MTTKAEFDTRIQTSLSGNLVDVELTQPDLDNVYLLAKQTFLQLGNANTIRDFYSLPVTKDVTTYTLPEEITQVSNVIRPKSAGIAGYEDPFIMSAYDAMFNYSSYGGMGSFILYDLSMQMQETIQKYTIYESEWTHNRYTREIRFLKTPHIDQNWVLDCYHKPTDEQLYDNLWIFKYALAEAKCILGRAYRKFGTLPSPTGENQIDGDQLVTEGKEEKRELEESVMDFQYGDPDAMGIYIG